MTAALLILATLHSSRIDPRLDVRTGPSLAITGITVIDGTGSRPLRNATILIDKGRFVAVGSSKTPIPTRAKRIDGRGKFAIPGMWDMHTHVDDPELVEVKPTKEEKAQWLPLFVLNGVTSIREMAGDLDLVKGWSKSTAAGALFGPRIFFGGPLVDGPSPMWPESIAIDGAEKGRQVVRDLKARGADFVKVYSLLGKESFLAIADEAKKQGIPVCGHVPVSVTNREAMEAGLNSIEHLLQLERELVDSQKLADKRSQIPQGLAREERFEKMAEAWADCYSESAADDLFRDYKKLGTWIDPTLVVSYENAFYEPTDPKMAARTMYIPAYVRDWWSPEENVHFKNQSASLRHGQQIIHKLRMTMIKSLVKAGVPMMTGSDMGGNPHCFAGWGIHDELALLVQAGLTPMQALVCATSNPAKYMKVFDQVGSIEKGKIADLVILTADPLTDIHNVSKIDGVIQGGQLLDRKELDRRFQMQKKAVANRLEK